MNLPSFRLIKPAGLCLSLLFTCQNATAFDLKFESLNLNKISTSLTYDNLINKIPALLVLEERDAAYMVDTIKTEYLTFYSDKNENLRATYASGAYYIKYTSNW